MKSLILQTLDSLAHVLASARKYIERHPDEFWASDEGVLFGRVLVEDLAKAGINAWGAQALPRRFGFSPCDPLADLESIIGAKPMNSSAIVPAQSTALPSPASRHDESPAAKVRRA